MWPLGAQYKLIEIDLRSDTVTHPTPSMRRAMANAELGDDGWGDDQTVNNLQEKVADLLGKESALFVPSGTMANLTSILTHCQRGDEIIVGDQSHIYYYEYGGASSFGGVAYRLLPNAEDGTLDPVTVKASIRPDTPRFPRTSLVCLENTHNRCNGAVLSIEYINSIANIAHESGAALHIDSARLFNASISLGIPAKDLVASADSAMFCFSKGLSCPIGSIICGSSSFIEKARIARNSLGGGMRQVGVIAAAAIVALDEMIERLAEDHANARRLAEGLSLSPKIIIDPARIETNIVIIKLRDGNAQELLNTLAQNGLGASKVDEEHIRMVTHYGIYSQDIDRALKILDASIK